MGKIDFFNRIEQEIEYGNYSEIRRITLAILRKEPDNKDASYIRDYIEFHKKSNGRFETISLNNYLIYISRNINKFKVSSDNKLFLICIYKDLRHIDRSCYGVELYSLQNRRDEIKNVIKSLEQLNNPELTEFIASLNKIKKDFDFEIEREEQAQYERKQREREREEHEARKREREARIKVISFVFAAIAVIIAFAIKCS